MSNKTIVFEQKKTAAGLSYYVVKDIVENQATYLYFLTFNNPGESFSFSDSLQYKGFYIFSDQPDFAFDFDLQKLFILLGGLNSGVSLVWITNPDLDTSDFAFSMFQVPAPTTQQAGKMSGQIISLSFQIHNFNLFSSDAPVLTIDGSTQTAVITLSTNQVIKLAIDRVTNNFLTLENSGGNQPVITIPFATDIAKPPVDAPPQTEGEAPAGSLAFQGKDWLLTNLYQIINGKDDAIWGGAIRYHYKDSKTANAIQQINYPVFGAVESGSTAKANFKARLDLFYMSRPANTFFRVSDFTQSKSVFQANNLSSFSTVGNRFSLSVQADAFLGFYLTETKATDHPYYLSPLASYAIALANAGADDRMMLGLSALEFAKIGDGTILELVPNQSAFADTFDPFKDPELRSLCAELCDNTLAFLTADEIPPLLTDEYLTSWVKIIPKTAQTWEYFSQPLSSSYFSSGRDVAAEEGTFPIADALTIKIGDVSTNTPPIPLAFYWSIYTNTNSPNPTVKTPQVAEFERQILTGSRFNFFLPMAEENFGPIYSSPQAEALNGGKVISNNGYVIGVNEKPEAVANDDPPKPPEGTGNKLYLARSAEHFLSINANDKGVLDPILSTALMNNQTFFIINDWDKFPISSQLDISGFTFNVQRITVGDEVINPIAIFKFAETESLLELIDNPGSWSDPNYFLQDGNVQQVTQALNNAIKQANSTIGTPEDPFEYFRNVILTQASWTGVIIFNCPIDGRNMPPDFQMLLAGINGPLTAHHFGVELNQIKQDVQTQEPEIDKSSLFGVIYYEDEGAGDTPTPTDLPLYKFIVKELIVLFRNSTILSFNATVGLMVNELFNRAVELQTNTEKAIQLEAGIIEPNTFYIQGRYQKQGDQGTVTFTSTDEHIYDFNKAREFVRVIDQFMVNGASLVPTGSVNKPDEKVLVQSRFSVNGEIFFSSEIVPNNTEIPDLFSYGVVEEGKRMGLPSTGTSFNIQVILDKNGQPIQSSRLTTIDISGLAVTNNKEAVRTEGLVNFMPFRLSNILHADDLEKGLDLKSLGKGVNVVQLLGNTVAKPTFALLFDLPLGSLGSLAEVSASIDSRMVMAWGPSDTTPDNDGASLFIQLPEASAGVLGFNLEGIVQTVFGDANLMRVGLDDGSSVYVLLFNNVAISIFGIKLPPKVITDFVVFADPASGSTSNMAWNVAATQVTSASNVQMLSFDEE